MATAPARPSPLTERQAEILAVVARYYEAVHEGCPSTLVARRLAVHHETIRRQFAALHRKGWLVTHTSPATPARPFLARRAD